MVTVTNETAWERAMKRACARGLTAVFVRLSGQWHESDEYWKVDSTSRPGLAHYVHLNFSSAGIGAACDCEAALNDRACCHVSAALKASDELHSRQPTPLPTPKEWLPRLAHLYAED